jgi:hypothetical protein
VGNRASKASREETNRHFIRMGAIVGWGQKAVLRTRWWRQGGERERQKNTVPTSFSLSPRCRHHCVRGNTLFLGGQSRINGEQRGNQQTKLTSSNGFSHPPAAMLGWEKKEIITY